VSREKRERRVTVEHQTAKRIRFDADCRARGLQTGMVDALAQRNLEESLDPRRNQSRRADL